MAKSECAGCGISLSSEDALCPTCNDGGPGALADTRKLARTGAVHHLLLTPWYSIAALVLAFGGVAIIVRRFREFSPPFRTGLLVAGVILIILLVLSFLAGSSDEQL